MDAGLGSNRGSTTKLSIVSMRKSSVLVAEEDDVIIEPLLNPQVLHIGHYEGGQSAVDKVKRVLDSDDSSKEEPRPIFCELLYYYKNAEVESPSRSWRESSRWVKFEETVEEGGTRWSKPHVTLVTVQQLLQIRNALTKGVTLLDITVGSFWELVDLCCRTWSKRHQVLPTEIDSVKQMLLQPKEHLVGNKIRSMAKPGSAAVLLQDVPEDANQEEHQRTLTRKNQALMRKMPDVTEAACIFVGYNDMLRECFSTFVRLKTPKPLMDIIELPILTRFVYILLIPSNRPDVDGKAIGRCMGTLMVDEIFSKVAYKAGQGYELGFAVEEFLHHSTIVPAGKWNRAVRWEPPENQPQTERRLEESTDIAITNSLLVQLSQEEEMFQRRTGKCFGGLIEDIRLKSYWFKSDIQDAFLGRFTQSLAAAIFLFFANLSKIITFGGVMDHQLHKRMGAIENVLAGGICGMIYALFSGQPLCVLSATGPCLVFEVILFNICEHMQWTFLPIRAWVGIWTSVWLMIYVALDASVLVALITRFTEEAFATMISLIFLVKAFDELWEIKKEYPITLDPKAVLSDPQCMCYIPMNNSQTLHHHETFSAEGFVGSIVNVTNSESCSKLGGEAQGGFCHFAPEIFMFSIILMFSTFMISMMLKFFRHTSFFTSRVRNIVADFNAIIAICVMTGVNLLVGINVPRLSVPDSFKPTINRSWFVDPLDIPHFWIVPATILPAAFFSILVMMDQNITSVIINRPDNKLCKGFGYHLDLAVISVLMIICSLFGLPFYVAATVISLLHVDSLRIMSSAVAPGEKPRFIGIREQRVTAFVAHLLIGLAVFLTPIMKFLPMPVLLGVFLYIGIVSLSGQQFGQRILLLFMPMKHQPDYQWLRSVRIKRVHLFTAIQLISFLLLLFVEEHKKISMIFPMMLFVMVLIRKIIMERIFTQKELMALDDRLPSWSELFKPQIAFQMKFTPTRQSNDLLRKSDTDEEKMSLQKIT